MALIRSIVFNILFYGATAVMSIIGLPLLLLPGRVIEIYAHCWAVVLVVLLRVVGIRHRIIGPRPKGPVIYAAKHQAAWETITLYPALGSPAPVMKRSLVFYPLIGLYFLKVPSVPIDRSAGVQALRSLKDNAIRIAAMPRSILIFPQGTRVAPGREHPYHAGTYAIYAASGLPVVPVALNSGLFWGRENFVKKPGEITVELLPPIPPGLDRKAFMKQLEDSIENATNALPGMAEASKKG